MLEEFFKNDLNYIKENLNLDLLKQKDVYGYTILHHFLKINKDVETIKYIFDFTQKNYPSLFLEKNNCGSTIIHYLFIYNNDLETIKYVIDFTKKITQV